jgi:hypothetical protein
MRQTAVEWLLDKFQEIHKDYGGLDLEWLKRFEQAKEKEYRQITNAYQAGNFDGFNKMSVDYYRETFLEEEDEIEF